MPLRTFLFSGLSALNSPPTLADFLPAIWLAIALLPVRYTYEALVLPRLTTMFLKARTSHPSSPSRPPLGPCSVASFAVLDSTWIATFSGLLAVFAWWVTVTDNGGCTPWSTTACFASWPHHPVSLGQRWYMVLAFAYYLYELFGTCLGLGTRLKKDMVAHHIVTMALIVIAYEVTLHRMSVMWQALFDITNPLLHAAKALHASELRWLDGPKWLLFNSFALLFLLCRVIGGFVSILWPSFTIARAMLPHSYCLVCWGLEIFVYLLQLLWFYKIVEIALKGEKAAKTD